MLVKSLLVEKHPTNLEQCFKTLRKFQLKLNPIKCAFGVSVRKFLGYIVHHRGIEENPKKIKAILEMSAPRSIKEVQQLIGRIAALGRFLSRSAKRGSLSSKPYPGLKILSGTLRARRPSTSSRNVWLHHQSSPSQRWASHYTFT